MNVERWKALSTQLKELKVKEAELRRDICQEIIGSELMENGRVTVRKTIEGRPVKAVQALSYSLDLGVLESIWSDLNSTEKDAIKLKPTLVTGKYKKLPDTSLLQQAVTSKLAMPTLEVGEI